MGQFAFAMVQPVRQYSNRMVMECPLVAPSSR
jgi:hypothetical protein